MIIAALDTMTLIATASAMFYLISGWEYVAGPDTRKLIALLLVFSLTYTVSFWVEWTGWTFALEKFEDFIGALIPMFWALLFYGYIQKEMNLTLRQSKEHLRVTLDSIGDGMIATDSTGHILLMNHPAEVITGWTFEEARNNPLSEIIQLTDPQTGAPIENPVNQVLQSNRIIHLSEVARLINREGVTFYITDSAAPIRGDTGELLGVVLTFRDDTETYNLRKVIEQKEKHIRRTQKLEALGQLAGGVAHDLNNLLTPILGYSELLTEDSNITKIQCDALNTIARAGKRARDLVRQLLAFSRKQTLEFRPLNLSSIVHDFQNLLRRTIPEDIHIQANLPSDLPIIQADIGQIEQIIMNLAVNAADAMPNGGTLFLETGDTELDGTHAALHDDIPPGHYVTLSISDTGCGMDQKTRDRIYDPFFSTKGESGTGLGLATVFGIVEQHAGTIWLYSEPGKGTTFKIYLPVAKNMSDPEYDENDEIRIQNFQGSETILLVEDNELVRQLTYARLVRLGYTVKIAQNGRQALDILHKSTESGHPIDLLLTDVVMPEMNGRELYEQAQKRYPDLKLLYMSGYPRNIISCRGILEENIPFLQKPFSAHDIAKKIRQVITAHKPPKPNHRAKPPHRSG